MAQTYSVSLGTSQRGWVGDDGTGNPGNGNYFTGELNGREYRNYFIFDLSEIYGQVLSAEISFEMPERGMISVDDSELFALREVNSYIGPDEIADPSIFEDLGDGEVFGAAVISTGVTGVTVDLGSGFIDLLNAGGLSVTLGGHLTSLDENHADSEYVFAFSNTNQDAEPSPVQLHLTVDLSGSAIPEPSSAVMLGFASLFLLRRQRK